MPDRRRIDPDATYTMMAAMRATGVGLGTIRPALVSGRLPATRPGFRWQIKGSDLLAWQPYRRAVPPGLLSVAQVAARVGVSVWAVRAAIAKAQLRATRDGARYLVAPTDVAAWRREMEPIAGPLDPDRLYAPGTAARAGKLAAVATAEGKRVQGADVLAWRRGLPASPGREW